LKGKNGDEGLFTGVIGVGVGANAGSIKGRIQVVWIWE
jgi:hypothetical protein